MKKALVVIGMFVVYFALVFLCEFLGFFSPVLWVYFGVIAAFLAATPVLVVASKTQVPGAIALFPVVYLIIMALLGEVSQPIVAIAIVVVLVIAELVRRIAGAGKQLGLRLGYAISAIAPGMYLLPLWTMTSWYYDGAIEEMGSQAYADTLMAFANPVGLVALVVLCFAAGLLGAIVSEKLFKDKVIVSAQ